MVANKTRDKIAKMSLKPILEHLSNRAHNEVIENFCKAQCGQCPDGWWLCADAKRVHRRFTALLFELYAGRN